MVKETKPKLTNYIPSIDGLRAVAVICVIVNHFEESLMPSGFLGVDIFFVISGFVITGSLINRKETNPKKYFVSFYKRRIKRLFPALAFSFIIGSLLIGFFNPEPKKHIITGLLSLFGFSNLYLFRNSVDYWSPSAKLNPFTHTWSLGIEEQFYMVYPLLLALAVSCVWSRQHLIRSTISLIVLSLISLVCYLVYAPNNSELTYFLLPFRLWELGFGCIVCLLFYLWPTFSTRYAKKLHSGLLLFLMVVTLFVPNIYPFVTTPIVVLLTVLLTIRLKHNHEGSTEYLSANYFLQLEWVQYIGKISYSLYLWHWIVIVIARWTIGVSMSSLPVLIVVIFLMSMISYYLLEKPLRNSRWRSSLRLKVLIPLSVVIVFFWAYAVVNVSAFSKVYLGDRQFSGTGDLGVLTNPNTSVNKIRLLGNSHTLHLLPMLRKIARSYDIKLLYNKHPNYTLIPGGDYKDMDKLGPVMSELDDSDLVILSSRLRYIYKIPYYGGDGRPVDHSGNKKLNGFGLDVWLDELDILLDQSDVRGVNVVFFMPLVEFEGYLPVDLICEDEWFRNRDTECNPSVSRDYLDSRFPPEFFEEIRARTFLRNNFYVFDPRPVYCPYEEEECFRVVDDVVAYRDGNHLSKAGSLLMLDAFYDFLIDKSLL